MDAGNDDLIFSARLTPHRSLGRRGFLLLMAAIALLSFSTGLYFWSLGAWPILGFFGLDFLAIWIAFRLNYRAARTYEEVEVSRRVLVIRHVDPRGRMTELCFNPHWIRLELQLDDERQVTRLLVRSREALHPIGTFLNPPDRTSFAHAFGMALAEARR
jgi:uncharacterized membrane protein